jgi:hypothetical protein
MATYWKPHKTHPCDDGKARTVYIRGEVAPFVGWMATPDTYFSCAAYVRHRGKRVLGFVGTCGDDTQQTFYPLDRERHKLA